MKKQTHQPDDLWEALTQLPEPPISDGMEARFWSRFEEELGDEERHRQQQHHWLRQLCMSLWAEQSIVWTAGFAAAFCVLWSAIQPTPTTQTPGTLAAAHRTSDNVQRPKAAKLPTQPLQLSQLPREDKELYQHMPVLDKMELFENFDAIQQHSKGKDS